ncbi:MAG: hypothetical protein Q9163_000999 [Psora crenata]
MVTNRKDEHGASASVHGSPQGVLYAKIVAKDAIIRNDHRYCAYCGQRPENWLYGMLSISSVLAGLIVRE